LKISIRTCVGCDGKKPKSQMIRVGVDSGWMVSRGNVKMKGRGAYVCPNGECIDRARRQDKISRSLKTCAPARIFEEIESFSRGIA